MYIEVDDRTVGDEILRLRKEHNLNQSQLAQKANVSRCSIVNYENGYQVPTILAARKIFHALGIQEVRIRT